MKLRHLAGLTAVLGGLALGGCASGPDTKKMDAGKDFYEQFNQAAKSDPYFASRIEEKKKHWFYLTKEYLDSRKKVTVGGELGEMFGRLKNAATASPGDVFNTAKEMFTVHCKDSGGEQQPQAQVQYFSVGVPKSTPGIYCVQPETGEKLSAFGWDKRNKFPMLVLGRSGIEHIVKRVKEYEDLKQRALAEENKLAQEAIEKFNAEAKKPKSVGDKVCSADNRYGYVEVIRGENVMIRLRGKVSTTPDSPPTFTRAKKRSFRVLKSYTA